MTSYLKSLLQTHRTMIAPMTAHTTNPVPFILVNADPAYTLREGGCLADIIPTLIDCMGMEKPVEMTGESLLIKK